MTSNADILDRTTALIERGWCKGAFALTTAGRSTNSRDPEAVAWCLVGAIRAQTQSLVESDNIILEVRRTVGCMVAADWQDAPERTKEQVVTALRRTAARLRAERRL